MNTKKIDIVLPESATYKWHLVLRDRLLAAEYSVELVYAEGREDVNIPVERLTALERRITGGEQNALMSKVDNVGQSRPRNNCDLVIDLAGDVRSKHSGIPALTVLLDGETHWHSAAITLCRGSVPVIDICLDGRPIFHAEPMASSRVLLSRGFEDVVGRIITSIVAAIDNLPHGNSVPASCGSGDAVRLTKPGGQRLAWEYATRSLPRLFLRAAQQTLLQDHWYVGYRFIQGRGVTDTGTLTGEPWSLLSKDTNRFLADPFPIEWQGEYYVFVEELSRGSVNGVISVCEVDSEGPVGQPRQVLYEDCHLSYPQVFARDGEVWMIPESGNGNRTSLYRARKFPDEWVLEKVLIENRALFDATLLDHDGRMWLFAAERDDYGTASDTMVVYFADTLTGPWIRHPANPIIIDKAAARPGGAFTVREDKIVLPLQNGSRFYGGGLGLSELKVLNIDNVELSKPQPIEVGESWICDGLHTLNRAGRLETIDGFSRVPRVRSVLGSRNDKSRYNG